MRIKRLLSDHHIQFISDGEHSHNTQGWCNVHCPFCTGSQNYHLGIHEESGACHCWRCGGHSVSSVFKKLLGPAVGPKALKELGKTSSVSSGPAKPPQTRKREISWPPGTESLQEPHKKYLKSRRFCPETLQRLWHIKATSYKSGIWNWRIMIPIYDFSGRFVSYQGRAISKEMTPKYLFPPGDEMTQNPREILYGIESVPGDTVIIVEGPTDVWRIGPGAVATLGVSWKAEQAAVLRKFERRFIIFDPDDKSQRQAVELANWLSLHKGITEIIWPGRTDPGDFTDNKVTRLKNLINA